MSHSRRIPAANSRCLVGKLSAYAAAGAALGATDATAAIIHTDLGPTGVTVTSSFAMDLDTDGQADFRLDRINYSDPGSCSTSSSGSYFCTGSSFFANGLEVNAQRSNRIHANERDTIVGVVLNEAIGFANRARIPTSGELHSFGFLAMSYRVSTSSNGPCDGGGGCYGYVGQFLDSRRAYLGLVLDLPDGPHAGWADIEWRGLEDPAVIYGFAYESTPGVAIAAGAVPEQPSLVLLAAGAAGLGVLRCRRSKHAGTYARSLEPRPTS